MTIPIPQIMCCVVTCQTEHHPNNVHSGRVLGLVTLVVQAPPEKVTFLQTTVLETTSSFTNLGNDFACTKTWNVLVPQLWI